MPLGIDQRLTAIERRLDKLERETRRNIGDVKETARKSIAEMAKDVAALQRDRLPPDTKPDNRQ